MSGVCKISSRRTSLNSSAIRFFVFLCHHGDVVPLSDGLKNEGQPTVSGQEPADNRVRIIGASVRLRPPL
jgi:hypothetical protein